MNSTQLSAAPRRRTRFIIVGGFFGAGKTTLLSRMGKHLEKKGRRVGFISNDQGEELVDTAILRSQGFDTEEVCGGCFCRQIEELTEAARRLRERVQPDILIAEAAGSCTDLVASVSNPLQRLENEPYAVAPLSVIVDPVRAERMLGLERGSRFSEKICYTYRKQIQEADLIVINKSELLNSQKLSALKQTLMDQAPGITIFTISAGESRGLEEWAEHLLNHDPLRDSPFSLDYDLYAESEASLGWLNCTMRFSSVRYFKARQVLTDLGTCIQSLLQQERVEIAHLKMTLQSSDFDEMATLNLTRNDDVPEISKDISEPIQSGELILNLRAEGDPEILHAAVNQALLAVMEKSPELFARMEHSEYFRPSRPRSGHRIPGSV